MRYYISMEKNVKGFERYQALWRLLSIEGIRVDSMSEGIKKTVEIQKSKSNDLYFIAIVSGDIDYLPQLKILREETKAPILVASKIKNDIERVQALENGADCFDTYSNVSQQHDLKGVTAVIRRIEWREKQKDMSLPSRLRFHEDMLISPNDRTVFFNGKQIDMTYHEFELLYYLMDNSGLVLSFKQIYEHVWKKEYDESVNQIVTNLITRIRKKTDRDGKSIIENEKRYGYRIPV